MAEFLTPEEVQARKKVKRAVMYGMMFVFVVLLSAGIPLLLHNF